MKTIKIIPIGGRIKSAAVGLNHFIRINGDSLEDSLRNLRKNPSKELLSSFFPSDLNRLKQMMRGIGFYRPVLKTDQGMAGNFLPFYIDKNLQKTDFTVKSIAKEEGLIIPELYLEHDSEKLKLIQESFSNLDLIETHKIIEPLLKESREADKGRIPFFFVRPAILSSPIIFGNDVLGKVNTAVLSFLEEIELEARSVAEKNSFKFSESNILYFQADVFITKDFEVMVEKINFPDVGLFFTEIETEPGSIAEKIQGITLKIRPEIINRIVDLGNKIVYFITRDEVLEKSEDVLELLELKSISKELEKRGLEVKIKSLKTIDTIPTGSTCLLMNLAYQNNNSDLSTSLLNRYNNGELLCYPNPFIQMVSKRKTGITEHEMSPEVMIKFFDLINYDPKNNTDNENVLKQIDEMLTEEGITAKLLHINIDNCEIVSVHREVHHSWKQLSNRINKHKAEFSGNLNNDSGFHPEITVSIRELPITHDNSLVDSNTGPRLCSFRFTFIV